MKWKVLFENSYMKLLVQALLNGLIIAGIVQFSVQAYQKHNARSLFLVTQAYPQFLKSANAVTNDYLVLLSLESDKFSKLEVVKNIVKHNKPMLTKYQLMDAYDARFSEKSLEGVANQKKVNMAAHKLKIDLDNFYINSNIVVMLLGVKKSRQLLRLTNTFNQVQSKLNKQNIEKFVQLAKKYGLSVKSGKQYISSLMSMMYKLDNNDSRSLDILTGLLDEESVYRQNQLCWEKQYQNFNSYFTGLNDLYIAKL
jgi:hypothetical protein